MNYPLARQALWTATVFQRQTGRKEAQDSQGTQPLQDSAVVHKLHQHPTAGHRTGTAVQDALPTESCSNFGLTSKLIGS
jgi:hypothetical protein